MIWKNKVLLCYLRKMNPESSGVPRDVERVGDDDDVVRCRFLPSWVKAKKDVRN